MGVLWKATPPPEAEKQQYVNIATNIGRQIGVPPEVMVGVIQQESNFDRTSYRWDESNEKDRSFGLMHLTIPTAQAMADKVFGKGRVAVNKDYLYNATNNIRLGATYLKEQKDRFGTWEKAISAYNAGRPISGNMESYVAKVVAKGKAISIPSALGGISIVVGLVIAWFIYKKRGGR